MVECTALLMACCNGDEVAEGIRARLEDSRSEHWTFEQQRQINKQSLWYCDQCFPVPQKGTRLVFSEDIFSSRVGLLHAPWKSSHLAILPLLVHGPASRCDGLSPTTEYMSAKPCFSNTGWRSYSCQYGYERFQPRNFASSCLRARNLTN